MTEETRKIAVLTGDIVGSTMLGPEKLERAMSALAECAETQADWHGESLRFTRNRGDGWQVVLAKPEMALRSALAFRAALRSLGEEFDSYIGIAIGAPPQKITENLNTETSKTFVESGRILELLKEVPSGIRMEATPTGPLTAASILADQISQDWTQPQAAAMLYALDPTQSVRYTDIARHLGKSRQAISKSLAAAGEKPMEIALSAIEQGGWDQYD